MAEFVPQTLPLQSSTEIAPGISQAIGRAAIRALYGELAFYPKPGLVSPVDNGAHSDMTMATFMRSLFSLRTYFPAIASAGAAGAEFPVLRDLGIEAERRMMAATGGINTHRGAIFNLGLLAASAGRHAADGLRLDANSICLAIPDLWGRAILGATPAQPHSNGLKATANHGGPGAREEAAAGYPVLRMVALPALQQARARGLGEDACLAETFFAILAVLNDTNILHRAGRDGLDFVQRESRAWLDRGGAGHPSWFTSAVRLHRAFCDRRISPGGAADLLSCTLFLDGLEALADRQGVQ